MGEAREQTGRQNGRASRRRRVAGLLADGRVEEVSGRQGGVTGLTEELGGLGSLEDSGLV